MLCASNGNANDDNKIAKSLDSAFQTFQHENTSHSSTHLNITEYQQITAAYEPKSENKIEKQREKKTHTHTPNKIK